MEISINRVEFKKEAKKLLDGKTWLLLLCNVCFLGIAGVQKYLCTVLWTLLIIFPGIMAHYRYGFTKYVFAKSNELTAGEAISKSKELTNGNKGQLFTLDLSFIGWFIIGIITCGLGLIFLIGYHEIVTAMYYKKISEESAKTVEAQQ